MSDGARTLEQWLRDAWDEPAAGCPPPEVWLAEEQAALDPADRERLAAHAAGCPACSSERELARAFDTADAGAAADDAAWVAARLAAPPAAAADRRPAVGNSPAGRVVAFQGRRAAVRWVRLAAAAVLVVAAGLMFQTLNLGSGSLPAPPASGTMRGGRVEVVAPVGELPAAPAGLRWRATDEAARYRVRLLAVDETELWQATVDRPEAALPAAVMALLEPAVSYRWSVEALGADGAVVGRSEVAEFRVAPEPEAPLEDGR